MTREQLEVFCLRIKEENEREREERNFFQMERDKLRTFWEITRNELEEARAKLRLIFLTYWHDSIIVFLYFFGVFFIKNLLFIRYYAWSRSVINPIIGLLWFKELYVWRNWIVYHVMSVYKWQ